jgi:hypothetical protein
MLISTDSPRLHPLRISSEQFHAFQQVEFLYSMRWLSLACGASIAAKAQRQ